MKRILLALLTGCLLIGTSNLVLFHVTKKEPHKSTPPSTLSKTENNIQAKMSKLWNDSIKHTHDYIMSTIAKLGDDKDAIAKRLTKTQDEIGDAIKPYYGDAAGNKLSKLLHEHVKIAKEVIDATKKKNNRLLLNSQKKWSKSAKEIATYLNSINAYWSKTDLTNLLSKYLKTIKNDAAAMVNKDQKKAISYYNEGRKYISEFATTLAKGIEKQFPYKVKK